MITWLIINVSASGMQSDLSFWVEYRLRTLDGWAPVTSNSVLIKRDNKKLHFWGPHSKVFDIHLAWPLALLCSNCTFTHSNQFVVMGWSPFLRVGLLGYSTMMVRLHLEIHEHSLRGLRQSPRTSCKTKISDWSHGCQSSCIIEDRKHHRRIPRPFVIPSRSGFFSGMLGTQNQVLWHVCLSLLVHRVILDKVAVAGP